MADASVISSISSHDAARSALARNLTRRRQAGLGLADDADRVARACHAMAERFHRGGKLIVFGNGGASTDAQHIAVEFVHPVIVGKRGLPAISMTNDAATVTGVANESGFDRVFAHQMRHLASPTDIAIGISADGNCRNVLQALELAHDMKLLNLAMTGGDGGIIASSPSVDFTFIARSGDSLIIKEIQVTTYHILWELVHVFLEQPGILESGS